MFLDGYKGIRMEHTDFKIFKCSLLNVIGESNKVDTAAPACHSCGKIDNGLLVCVKCKIAMYCDKECQRAHWKVHKGLCPDMTTLKRLVQLVREPYNRMVTFEELSQQVT